MSDFVSGDKVSWEISNNTFTGTVIKCYESRGTIPESCVVRIDSVKGILEIDKGLVGKTMPITRSILKKTLSSVINSKARNYELRRAYENITGQSAKPGNGPANLIREYAGVKVPKGAQGGSKKTRKARTKKTRRNKK
jgi:hypothetical protein